MLNVHYVGSPVNEFKESKIVVCVLRWEDEYFKILAGGDAIAAFKAKFTCLVNRWLLSYFPFLLPPNPGALQL